jgi:solute carrier family 45 protein 1/2/4
VIVAFCLLLLGWTSEVVGWLVHDAEKVRSLSVRMRLRKGS